MAPIPRNPIFGFAIGTLLSDGSSAGTRARRGRQDPRSVIGGSSARGITRATAVERYDLATVCLPQQVKLVEALAQGYPSFP